jgi:asparagine synthase (glutamine-hydrolysing)
MCGICGFFGLHLGDDGAQPAALLSRMIGAIRHRGPDEQGIHVDRDTGTGLGHARLSVIDLSTGQQPMTNEDGTVWVTFNGEIFNYVELVTDLAARGHVFKTHSDTETIVHAYEEYGPACVERFNGDFAFALYDRRRRRLMIARDRMGVRPVYYTITPGGALIFGSEVKALLQVPGVRAELDAKALDQTFTFWFPVAPRTPFKDIHELPPGHMLIAEGGNVTVKPYWRLTYPDAREAAGGALTGAREAALTEELRELLIDATRIRLRSDVPVGAYLSGGLDSSALTALIKNFAGSRLRTFSVGFETAEFDESEYQQAVVRALETDHESVTCTRREIGEMFPDVIRHMERPVIRTAPAPLFQLSRLVRENAFKVVMTGEGADEVFAGYDIFKEAKIRRFWARQPKSAWRPALLRRLYPYLAGLQGQPKAYLEAFFRAGLDRPADPFFSHLPRWGMTAQIKSFFSDDLRAQLTGYDAAAELRETLPREYASWHPLSQAQYLEAGLLLPGYILSSQGDRVAMANAVEGRFPFLDHRVVEFASRVPPRLKIKGLTEKHILREAVGKYLPKVIARRTKQPYRAPDSQSFFGPGAPEYVGELLSAAAINRSGYFDARAVERLVAKCRAGAGGGALGFKDNMALVGILSVQLLDHQFVRAGQAVAPAAARNVTFIGA